MAGAQSLFGVPSLKIVTSNAGCLVDILTGSSKPGNHTFSHGSMADGFM
jgi:hypothetical protein